MAEKNILYSAAYIYNLCRDFEKSSSIDLTPLFQFALTMKVQDFAKINSYIPMLKEQTNIDNIRLIVNEELAKNYQKLLIRDIENKYTDIMLHLRRIAEENQKEVSDILEMTSADLEEVKAKLEEQKSNYEEIVRCRGQLVASLKAVEDATQKRLVSVLGNLLSSSKNKG